jgi:hypothetical protein
MNTTKGFGFGTNFATNQNMLAFNTFNNSSSRLSPAFDDVSIEEQQIEQERQELLAIVKAQEEAELKKDQRRKGLTRSNSETQVQRDQLRKFERDMRGAQFCYDMHGQPVKLKGVANMPDPEIQPDVYLVHEDYQARTDPRDEDFRSQIQQGRRGRHNNPKRGIRSKPKRSMRQSEQPQQVGGFTPTVEAPVLVLAPGVKVLSEVDTKKNKENIRRISRWGSQLGCAEEQPVNEQQYAKGFLPRIHGGTTKPMTRRASALGAASYLRLQPQYMAAASSAPYKQEQGQTLTETHKQTKRPGLRDLYGI